MKLFTLAVAIAPLALASSLPANLPFNLTYLFTAELALGPPNAPITIPGGVRIAEAIVNGTVSGPALNGTIIGGLAVPAVYENQTVQAPIIEAYGASKDGVTFRLHEEGIGSPQAQVTRIQLEIGGGQKYSHLRNGFILASVNPSADRKVVHVKGYLVQNTV